MRKYFSLAALGLYLTSGIAADAQTTNNNRIYACYQNNSETSSGGSTIASLLPSPQEETGGQLRKVDGPSRCKPSEVEISWNITGPQGNPGPQGPPGPRGLTGLAGPQGPPGEGLSDHHKEIRFTLGTTESRTFSLPRTDFPVRIDVSTSNVAVIYNSTTTNLGPFVLDVVASFDSVAGIGNINNGAQCPGKDSCGAFSFYNLPEPNFFACNTGVDLKIDRHTGNMTVSLRTTQNCVISPGQVNYVVSMWY